jgi:hypothetical protein
MRNSKLKKTQPLSSKTVCAIISECLQFQGAQTVGMGAEAQSVPAAAKLFNQANDILGYLQASDSTCVFFFGWGWGSLLVSCIWCTTLKLHGRSPSKKMKYEHSC